MIGTRRVEDIERGKGKEVEATIQSERSHVHGRIKASGSDLAQTAGAIDLAGESEASRKQSAVGVEGGHAIDRIIAAFERVIGGKCANVGPGTSNARSSNGPPGPAKITIADGEIVSRTNKPSEAADSRGRIALHFATEIFAHTKIDRVRSHFHDTRVVRIRKQGATDRSNVGSTAKSQAGLDEVGPNIGGTTAVSGGDLKRLKNLSIVAARLRDNRIGDERDLLVAGLGSEGAIESDKMMANRSRDFRDHCRERRRCRMHDEATEVTRERAGLAARKRTGRVEINARKKETVEHRRPRRKLGGEPSQSSSVTRPAGGAMRTTVASRRRATLATLLVLRSVCSGHVSVMSGHVKVVSLFATAAMMLCHWTTCLSFAAAAASCGESGGETGTGDSKEHW